MSDAKKMRLFRENQGLTQEEAAAHLNVSVYTISSIESNRRSLSTPQAAYVDAVISGEMTEKDTPYSLLGRAIKALERGDRDEAIRMCHCALILLCR